MRNKETWQRFTKHSPVPLAALLLGVMAKTWTNNKPYRLKGTIQVHMGQVGEAELVM